MTTYVLYLGTSSDRILCDNPHSFLHSRQSIPPSLLSLSPSPVLSTTIDKYIPITGSFSLFHNLPLFSLHSLALSLYISILYFLTDLSATTSLSPLFSYPIQRAFSSVYFSTIPSFLSVNYSIICFCTLYVL